MNSTSKNTAFNIGGAFSLMDTDPFIVKNGDYLNYFPETLNASSKRFFLETGADAMAFILKGILDKKKVEEVFFPFHYCQDSIERLNIKVKGLHIKRYKNPTELYKYTTTSVVFWNHLNVYSALPNQLITNKNLIIIEDFVQAPLDIFKSKSSYCFNSLRKFCNLELAICYTNFPQKISTSNKASAYYKGKKNAQLIKHYFQKTAFKGLEKEYLDCFKQAEKKTACSNIIKAFITEEAKLKHINFNAIKSKRLTNYDSLLKQINNIKKITVLDGSYMYMMIECENRDGLRNYLAQNNIYTAVHWADSHDKIRAKKSLSIHIDHRYNIAEIEKVAMSFLSYYE